MHRHLKSDSSEDYELRRTHVWRICCARLEKVILIVPDVIEKGHGVADDLNDDEHEEGDDLGGDRTRCYQLIGVHIRIQIINLSTYI